MVVVATHDHRLLPLADQVVELVPNVAMSVHPPERRAIAAGETVFSQGQWGELIYVVESGTIEIVGERADGTEEARAVVEAGEYFGEFGPLFGIPRSATARARTDAVVTGYSTRDFRERVGDARALAAPSPSQRARRRRVNARS